MPVILQNIEHPVKNGSSSARSIKISIETLKINDGEFVGIIDAGEGGAVILGKIICGLVHPKLGNLSMSGISVFLDCECEKAFSELSVEKEMCRHMNGTKLKKDEMLEEAKSALVFVGFDYDTIKNRSPFELSAGDRRKIAIAAALALHPDVLVLNDPMRDMDELWCSRLMELLKKINNRGTTVLLLTSDTSRLAEAADRIIILKNGSLVIDSSAKTVFSEYYALIHLGIPVPEVKKCCQMLRARGMDMPNNIILYDQFIDRLKILLWRKNK